MSDLLLFSKIDAAASAAGAKLVRVDSVDELAGDVGFDLILVDWSERSPNWASRLADLAKPQSRLLLFGRHTDLAAHEAARDAGLGPMWARSRLVGHLAELFAGDR
ncbi:MAG: hypothetical protein ABIW50_04900 [Candidatus Limnocylindria bacterium]